MAKGSVNHNKRTLLTNAAWNWLGFATAVAVTFVVCPIYIRYLGDTRYGIWSLVLAVVAYFSLLDLGIGASVVRYVAKFEAINDKDELNRIFSTTCGLFIGAAIVAITISLGMALFWRCPFGVPVELAADTRWLILLLGCNVGVQLVTGVFGAVLIALGRFPARVITEIILQIGTAVAMVAALGAGYGLLGIGVVCLAATVIKGCALAVIVWQYLPQLRFSFALINLSTFRTIRGYSILALLAMIAGRISFATDSIIIGAFLAPEYITYFVLAARLTEYVKGGSWSITNVLTPAISSLEAIGRHEEIKRVFIDGTRYVMLLVIPFVIGLLVLGKPFLTLWLGERLSNLSYPSLVILSIPLFLLVPQSIIARILYGIGRLKWFTAIVMTEALTNLVLSIILVRSFGIEGVAIGTAIPNVCATLVLAVYTCRILGVSFFSYAKRSFARPLLFAPVAPVVWSLAMHWIPITNWTAFVLVGALGTLAYGFVVFFVELRPNIAAGGFRSSWQRLRCPSGAQTDESDMPTANPADIQ